MSLTILTACDHTRIHRSPADPRSLIEFHIADEAAYPGAQVVHITAPDMSVYVRPEVLISNGDIRDVVVEPSRYGYRISLLFTEQAATRLHNATAQNIGKRIAITVDGSVVIAPVIQEPIGEQAAIERAYSKEEAINLARRIAP